MAVAIAGCSDEDSDKASDLSMSRVFGPVGSCRALCSHVLNLSLAARALALTFVKFSLAGLLLQRRVKIFLSGGQMNLGRNDEEAEMLSNSFKFGLQLTLAA